MATGGGSSRGVGVGCGLAVAVGGAADADTAGEGVGGTATDAAGTPLVTVHAVRSHAAHSAANGATTHPFFTQRQSIDATSTGSAMSLSVRLRLWLG